MANIFKFVAVAVAGSIALNAVPAFAHGARPADLAAAGYVGDPASAGIVPVYREPAGGGGGPSDGPGNGHGGKKNGAAPLQLADREPAGGSGSGGPGGGGGGNGGNGGKGGKFA